MRNLFTSLVALLIVSPSVTVAQGIYFDMDPVDVEQAGVKLYIDISSPECNCDVLSDVAVADPLEPLYIWTWQPNESRPPYQGQDVTNGSWQASNPNLVLQQDPDNPSLWYFDFLGASIADFYGVSSEVAQAEGLHFLLKKQDGSGDPEPKSPDLFISLMQQEGGTDFLGIDLDFELFATGFNRPCEIVNTGVTGDERLFVVEQAGRIRILDLEGNVASTPFLNIQSSVNSAQNEEGLLGLAFSPDYADNGYFFVNYTRLDGTQRKTRISRFSVDDSNPDLANPASEVVLLEFNQDFANHNGGQIAFGPDGFLYISVGDGGSGGDPNDRAQDIMSFLGKMLRIDVGTVPYSIPDDNPFAEVDFGLDEIWSYGLRNTWKFAFDELEGDLYMADVGQNNREEVNFEPAGFVGGANYGWRCYEGFAPYNLVECDAPDYVFPIMDYQYGNQGNGFRCSITGGRVYRGETYGNLYGKYFAVDYCNGEYWVMWQENGEWEVYLSPTTTITNLVAFGTDLNLELYGVKGGTSGQVYKLKENCSLLEVSLTSNDEGALVADLPAQTYTWYLNGEVVYSGPEASYIPLISGVYQVQAFTANGCTAWSDEFEYTTMSTSNYKAFKLGIYPNPAAQYISVNVDQAMRNGLLSVSIFSTDGRLVEQFSRSISGSQPMVLELSHLPKGYYLLQASGEDGVAVAPFVKQ